MELKFRGFSPLDNETVAVLRGKLRELLDKERDGVVFQPISNFNLENEVELVEAKVAEILEWVNGFEKGDRNVHPSKIKTALYHYTRRISVHLPQLIEPIKTKGKVLYKGLQEITDKFKGIVMESRSQFVNVPLLPERNETAPSVGEDHSLSRERTQSVFKIVPFYKWNINFSASRDENGNRFIERVEELAVARGVDQNSLAQGAVDFFSAEALTRYRLVKCSVGNWADLKIALRTKFLPRDYEESLWEEIRSRKQRTDERVSTLREVR